MSVILDSSSNHYDITISSHITSRLSHPISLNGTPPPAALPTSSLLYPPRPLSPLRHATLTFTFQSSDFTDARYQLPVPHVRPRLLHRAGRPSWQCSRDGRLGRRAGGQSSGGGATRLPQTSSPSTSTAIAYTPHPLAKTRKDALLASPTTHSPSATTDEPATVPVILKPLPLPAYLLSVASSAFLLLCSSPKSSRAFVLLSNDASSVLRFFGLVSDIIATPRSDQWLDVPDAARMQSQLRLWEEEKEAEMLREEEDRKLKLAIRSTNGHDVATASIDQPVAMYLSATSNTRPARSALLTSSTRSSQLGGIRNLGNSCYMSAILQALLSIPAFVSALTSPRLISAEHELPSPLSSSSFYWHLASLALLYQQSDHGVLDIGELKEVIGSKRERFAGNTQQDAHEFLSECLNALQDDVVKCVRSSERAEVKAEAMVRSDSGDSGDSGSDDSSSGGRSSRSPSPLPLPLIRSPSASSFISSALPRHMQRLIHRLSPIHRTFHCEIEYTLTCTNPACGYTRKNKESCYDLSLDLPDLPAPSTHRLASPIPTATASPLLSAHYSTSSPSPEHSPTLSPALSPRASPSLPPLSLSAHENSPDVITLDAVRSASPSPSIDAMAASPSPPVPRRRQKASAPPSSSLSSLLSTFFSARTLTCNCAHCPSTTVTISAAMRQMPAVLILHVKRFLPNLSKGSYDKRSDRVKVETELNVSFACKPDTKRPGVDDEKDNKQHVDSSEKGHATQQTSRMETDEADELMSPRVVQLATVDENGVGHSSNVASLKANGLHAPVALRPTKRAISDEIDLTRSDESDNSPVSVKKYRRNNANNQSSSTSPPVSPTNTASLATTTRNRRTPTTSSSDIRVTRAMHKKLTSASIAAVPAAAHTTASSSPSPSPPSAPLPPTPSLPPPLPAPPVYQLSSIVHHRGAFAFSGHYLTDIVRGGSGVWTRYDDQFVKDVTCEHSLRQAESEGYIFFYVYGSGRMG